MKILFSLLLLIAVSYFVTETYGGKIMTYVMKEKTSPYVVKIEDIDLHPLKGQIEVQNISVTHSSGRKVARLSQFMYAPRIKKGTLFFSKILVKDGEMRFSAADIPENLNKKTEPLPLKPRFDDVRVENLEFVVAGVKGLEGDKNLTLRNISGTMDCHGSVLCLNSDFKVDAEPMSKSVVAMSGHADVREVKDISVRGELKNLRIGVFNTLLPDASPVKAKSGRINLFTEFNFKGNDGKGYMKFFAQDLELDERKDEEVGFIAKVVGNVVADKKLDYFDLKIPLSISQKKITAETVDLKNELKRLVNGEKLSPGFELEKQAQEQQD